MTCNNVTLFLSLSIYLSFFLSLFIYLYISLCLTIQSLSHYTISISLYNLYLTIQQSLSLCISNSIHSVFFSHSFNITLTKAQPFFSNYLPLHFMFAISLSLSLSLSLFHLTLTVATNILFYNFFSISYYHISYPSILSLSDNRSISSFSSLYLSI